MRNPGVSRGTMNMVVPSRRGTSGLVRASMKKSFPTVALAMKHFSPFRIHSSPLRSAKLEARFGIVRGRQAVVGAGVRLADALAEEKSVVGEKRFEKPLLLLIGANRRDQVAPLPALAEGLGDGAVGPGELHHHQRLRHEVGSLPAPLLGNRHRAKAEPGSLLDDLPVESLARMADRVARERYRTDLLQRELARLHLPGALLFVQGKVHVESLR